jgi:hypothetical protein
LDSGILWAFKDSGMKYIPFEVATPEEIDREKWKASTQNDGNSIK